MRKPTICICENKDADQLRCNHEADQRLCFRYTVQFLYFINPKFIVSSHLLCLYSSVCVGPVQNPNCWFSQAQAQMSTDNAPGIVDFFHVHVYELCHEKTRFLPKAQNPECRTADQHFQGRIQDF